MGIGRFSLLQGVFQVPHDVRHNYLIEERSSLNLSSSLSFRPMKNTDYIIHITTKHGRLRNPKLSYETLVHSSGEPNTKAWK